MRETTEMTNDTIKGQNAQILAYLSEGNAITPLAALAKFGCLRLSARIWDLRDRGYDIKTRIISVGNNKNVAEYYFEK